MKHKHADLMLLYAQDAMESEEPWEKWEYSYNRKVWFNLRYNPIWSSEIKYRRKIKTININGFDVPEPVRKPLNYGDCYYIFNLDSGSIIPTTWEGDRYDHTWLKIGAIHLTEEAAKLHRRALLSFTKQDDNEPQ